MNELSDPLDGVNSAIDWWSGRRPALLELFEQHVYGRTPEEPTELDLGQVQLELSLPDSVAPAPVFLALRWEKDEFPHALLTERGYGLASAVMTEIWPDADDGRVRDPDEWGALGRWACGLSRLLDRLIANPRVDSSRVVVIGHSRLGKAALWAAAQDERFAMAVSNNSGCGGAALSRRDAGESVEAITSRFPYWFCPRFATYAGREHALPVDQHQLLALIAPRPVVVGSAADDWWADPEGERLGAELAAPVFDLLDATPPVYRIREGGHALRTDDWERYVDLADELLPPPGAVDIGNVDPGR